MSPVRFLMLCLGVPLLLSPSFAGSSLSPPPFDPAAAASSAFSRMRGVPVPPRGLDINGTEYALNSNGLWAVSVNGGPFDSDAKQVVLIAEEREGGTSARDRQDYAYVWARRCTAASQTLVFRRAIFMPGPEKSFGMDFYDTTGSSAPDLAIAGVRIYVNDRHIVSFQGGRWTVPRTDRHSPRVFKDGINIVKIHVTKRARNGTTIGQCQYGGRPLGLSFSLHGEFEADLWLSNDSSITHEDYERGTPGATEIIPVAVPPRNLGPSGVYRGTLTLHISGSTLKSLRVTAIRERAQEIEDCTTTRLSDFMVRVDCVIDRLHADRRRELDLVVDVTVTFHDLHTMAWVFVAAEFYSPTRDPNGRSNGWRAIRYICFPETDHPQCPPP